jgi:hypothetical protein
MPRNRTTPIWMTPESRDYYAELVAEARAQGRDPQPKFVAWAEGRELEPGEVEAWQKRLPRGPEGFLKPELDRPGSARSRSFDPTTRPAGRRPRWHLPSSSEETPRRSLAGESAELLETGSGFRIGLSSGVYTSIERAVAAAVWDFDSREVESGGWLYAHWPVDATDESVVIVHASGPGSNASHGNGTVRLSDPGDVEADFDDFVARQRLVRVGDWHSHPSRDPEPSPKDLSAWPQHADAVGRLPYIGVIATAGEDVGWMTPEYVGWVIREDEHGVLVCEPGRIEEP